MASTLLQRDKSSAVERSTTEDDRANETAPVISSQGNCFYRKLWAEGEEPETFPQDSPMTTSKHLELQRIHLIQRITIRVLQQLLLSERHATVKTRPREEHFDIQHL